MIGKYGNPHSRTHAYGWETEAAIEDSREEVAKLIGASAKEIIFTSGATESNNMSIKGIARFYGKSTDGKKKHVITTQTEHKCVLDSCRAIESEGIDVGSYLIPISLFIGDISSSPEEWISRSPGIAKCDPPWSNYPCLCDGREQ
jgi:cysteine sulfinate desulfinase/cysteine desulfurase-like protein